MSLRWKEARKIDFHAHVVLHEREDTDLRLNTPEMMLRAMEENNVERAVILPINHPDSSRFPAMSGRTGCGPTTTARPRS